MGIGRIMELVVVLNREHNQKDALQGEFTLCEAPDPSASSISGFCICDISRFPPLFDRFFWGSNHFYFW